MGRSNAAPLLLCRRLSLRGSAETAFARAQAGAPVLPAGCNAGPQDGGAVLLYGDFELGGEGGGLGVLVGGREQVPVAADGLVDFDGDGGVFVVAQGDFKFHFPGVIVDALVVGLLAFGDDVEGVADMHGDGFVFGSVIDAVFADEEDAAFGIFLVDADVAGG